MAKGSPFTTFVGKLGQTVGFIIKNSASKQVQGIRAYQSQVANPKTVLQSNQRLVMKPLNNIARALKPIIERGFEGVKYGAQSRQKFLSLNMSDFHGPYLVKGDERAVPGPFIISQGSLVPITIMGTTTTPAPMMESDLFVPFDNISSVRSTFGAFSSALIQSNSDIKDGDQLTFIAVYSVDETFIYRTESIIVDSTSTAQLAIPAGDAYTLVRSVGSLNLYFNPSAANNLRTTFFSIGELGRTDETLVAGAVIQSREGDNRNLRSNATLFVSDAITQKFMSAEALEAAINSYSATAGTTDWPEVKNDSETYLRDVTLNVPNQYLAHEYANGYVGNVKAFLTEGGYTGLYLREVTPGTRYQLVDANGNPITYQDGEDTAPLLLNGAGIGVWVDSGRWRKVTFFGDTVSA